MATDARALNVLHSLTSDKMLPLSRWITFRKKFAHLAVAAAIASLSIALPASAAVAPLAISGLQQALSSPDASIAEGQLLNLPSSSTIPLYFSATVPTGRSVKMEVFVGPLNRDEGGARLLLSDVFTSGRAVLKYDMPQPPDATIKDFIWSARFIDAADPTVATSMRAFSAPGVVSFRVAGKTLWSLEQHALTATNDAVPLALGAAHSQDRVRLSSINRNQFPLRVEVELKKKDVPYDGTGTQLGAAAGYGRSYAIFTLPASATENLYKWRARLVDPGGVLTTDWWEFGSAYGVPEGKTAFIHPIAEPDGEKLTVTGLQQGSAFPEGSFFPSAGPTNRVIAFSSDVPETTGAKLEVELKPMSMPFDGTGTAFSPVVTGGRAAASVEHRATVGSGSNLSYHWRARLIDVLHPANDSAWKEFGTPGNADFTYVGDIRWDSLNQSNVDAKGVAKPIAPGTATPTRRVRFSAYLDNDLPLRLEIELIRRPLTFNDGAPKVKSSALVTHGTASVTYDLVAPAPIWGDAYMWRARLVDGNGHEWMPWNEFSRPGQFLAPFALFEGRTDFFYGTSMEFGIIAMRQFGRTEEGKILQLPEGFGTFFSATIGVETVSPTPATLEFEIKPWGEPFDGQGTQRFDIGSGNGVTYVTPNVHVPPGQSSAAFHYRARVKTATQTADWRYFGTRRKADFLISVNL